MAESGSGSRSDGKLTGQRWQVVVVVSQWPGRPGGAVSGLLVRPYFALPVLLVEPGLWFRSLAG